jgi:ankyrin repeat protein
MAYAPPLPPPAQPPPGQPVSLNLAVSLDVGSYDTGLRVEKQLRIQHVEEASEERSLSTEVDAVEDFETNSAVNSVDQSIELDRLDDEGKVVCLYDEKIAKRPSWVLADDNHRVSNDDLQEAALRGDLGMVRRLVHAGASVNAPVVLESQDEIMTLLHALALRPEIPNCTSLIAEIMQIGVDINSRSFLGVTPLMCACKHQHAAAVEMLFEARAELDPEDDSGRNALSHAVIGKGKSTADDIGLEVLKLLDDAGVHFDDGGRHAVPPIVEAVKKDNVELVNELMKFGATPDGLPEAASVGSAEMINVLITARANPFVTDDDGHTALEISEKNLDDEIAELLIAYINFLQDIKHPFVAGIETHNGHPVRPPDPHDDDEEEVESV